MKRLGVFVDGRCVSPEEGFLVRKAPGCADFDFGQFIPLLVAASAGGGGHATTAAKGAAGGAADVRVNALAPAGGGGAGSSSLKPGAGSSAAGAVIGGGGAKGGVGELLRLGSVEQFELLDVTHVSVGTAASPAGGSMAHGGGAGVRRGVVTATPQQYEVPLLPQGCIFKFVLSASSRADARGSARARDSCPGVLAPPPFAHAGRRFLARRRALHRPQRPRDVRRLQPEAGLQ